MVYLFLIILLKLPSLCAKVGAIFVKKWYFVNNCLIKFPIWNPFTHCVTHVIVTAHHISFTQPIFSQIQIAFFPLKSPGVILTDGYLKKMLLQRAKIRRLFFPQNYGLKSLFYSNWKQFQVFKIANWIQGNSTLWSMGIKHPGHCLSFDLVHFAAKSVTKILRGKDNPFLLFFHVSIVKHSIFSYFGT